MKEEWKSR
jgi:hypothetical protein